MRSWRNGRSHITNIRVDSSPVVRWMKPKNATEPDHNPLAMGSAPVAPDWATTSISPARNHEMGVPIRATARVGSTSTVRNSVAVAPMASR